MIDLLVEKLRLIDGQVSPAHLFYAPYTFHTNVFQNVRRGFQFLDQINDFPYIMCVGGRTDWKHLPGGIIYKTTPVHIRSFVFNEEGATIDQMEDLAEDIEQIVNSLRRLDPDRCIVDSRVDTISTDEGLMAPYGVLDMNIRIVTENLP
jgi:hypothetical protein